MLADEVVDVVIGIDGLSGVPPESVDDVVLHPPLADEVIVHIGDLQFPATRRLQRRDYFEDRRIIEVDTGHGQCAGRVMGLFDDSSYTATVVELRNTKVTQVIRVFKPSQQDARAILLAHEGFDSRPYRSF